MYRLLLFKCLNCNKEQYRYVNIDNTNISCKFCKEPKLIQVLQSPNSHSIIKVQGAEKVVEVHGNWEEMRNAISKKPRD